MGYSVKHLVIHSMNYNKNYNIKLPEEDINMKEKFEKLIKNIQEFDIKEYEQDNIAKCQKCIYEPMCDRSCIC